MINYPELIAYVQKALEHESSGHDFAHTMRVYTQAERIAVATNACDADVVRIAALFHDIAYAQQFFAGEHGDVSAEAAKPVIAPLDLTDEQRALILHAISIHNFWIHKDSNVPIEIKILRDADRLDAIGYSGIVRAIAYAVNAKKDKIQSLEDQLTLEQQFETEKGKKLAQPRIAVIQKFIADLRADRFIV